MAEGRPGRRPRVAGGLRVLQGSRRRRVQMARVVRRVARGDERGVRLVAAPTGGRGGRRRRGDDARGNAQHRHRASAARAGARAGRRSRRSTRGRARPSPKPSIGVPKSSNLRRRRAGDPRAGGADAPRVTKSLKRSGFAGCSTKDLPAGEFIDLDAFTALRYRVRSDGRKYVASIRTDNWVTGGKEDLWQCFLFAPKDTWADVVLPIGRFLKTWRGGVLEHEYEMSKSKVVGLGLAVAGGGVEPPGRFRIELASVQGLRLDREELAVAIRRAEAGWGAAFGRSASAGSSPGTIGEGMGLAAEALRAEAFGRRDVGRGTVASRVRSPRVAARVPWTATGSRRRSFGARRCRASSGRARAAGRGERSESSLFIVHRRLLVVTRTCIFGESEVTRIHHPLASRPWLRCTPTRWAGRGGATIAIARRVAGAGAGAGTATTGGENADTTRRRRPPPPRLFPPDRATGVAGGTTIDAANVADRAMPTGAGNETRGTRARPRTEGGAGRARGTRAVDGMGLGIGIIMAIATAVGRVRREGAVATSIGIGLATRAGAVAAAGRKLAPRTRRGNRRTTIITTRSTRRTRRTRRTGRTGRTRSTSAKAATATTTGSAP